MPVDLCVSLTGLQTQETDRIACDWNVGGSDIEFWKDRVVEGGVMKYIHTISSMWPIKIVP